MELPIEEWSGQRVIGKRQFVCLLHFNGFENVNFGISINLRMPHIEFHMPFCFIQVGMNAISTNYVGNPWDAIWARLRQFKSFGKTLKSRYDETDKVMKYYPY